LKLFIGVSNPLITDINRQTSETGPEKIL